MNILILGFAKLRIMPYLNLYLDNIDKKSNKVTVLYWNRDLMDEDISKHSDIEFCEFRCYQEDDVAKISKIKSFLKYRNFAKRLLKQKFDRVVILHSLPGILLLFELMRNYSGKYILDYRDSTFERIWLFRLALWLLIKHSVITLTSSDAFRHYFPNKYQKKIYTTHNILEDSLYHREYERHPSDKIRIAFWGMIRHEDINKEIIDRLANDRRFELHYYGREQNSAIALKEYANKLTATNVFFHGDYVASDRYKFVIVTDVIHNVYFDNNTMLAIGNKYYDGLIFRIPQVCMPGSFMGKLCDKYHVGVSLSPYDLAFADDLYKYVRGLSRKEFNKNADKALSTVLEEYNKSVAAIKTVLK